MSLDARLLEHLDTFLHWALDWYVDGQHPGWGMVQLAQWHVCNSYERRAGLCDK